MSDLKSVFEDIAAHNRWDGEESRSGPGSSLAYTVNLRSQLEVFLAKFNIRIFFDAPCGDFNWMKEVRFPPGASYVGGDISSFLIERNKAEYWRGSRAFLEFDIAVDAFPRADVWFCRDCLFHLPDAAVFQALRNFCDSNIELLLMSNHLNTTGFENTDVKAGDFRLIDFYREPYCLPRDVLFRIADYVDPYPQREMCVWTREQVAGALQGGRAG